MTEGLEEIWNKLTLTEEEQEDILVEKEWVEDISEAGKNCLLGKMLMRKPVNMEAMRSVFIKIWKVSAGLSIREIDDRIFIFRFGNGLEKEREIQKQPWSFNKSLLVLRDFDGMSKPEDINMDWCPFWVQVHGLPLGLMNERIGLVLGESIGDVEEVETNETS